ncbi:FimV/HubP family polar landmark protein [Vibrio sp. Vb5032]|uniref:FimV/HubP family polar landmark protein n=1 Tax=unclassified Vibrio TaxID=2614977 RepID=UPI001A2A15AE|nr:MULTISPECIES: FimV/HubP family polar landmark protein [unclassified Vibrio]EGQ7764016.1 AAA family ATPase [Vibrio alginolyticus]EGR2606729.1 AAA family ATPase [Vibrio alginolyticus]MDW1521976.1 FimV/HubP family polar landmark protein [Vibrio sp. Vb5032]MDW2000885.1 FimV/HubP family polar landmark protein [Vibrio sp. 2304]
MRQNYKRLLAALVLMSATQTLSVVQAEGIRLVGPSGEVQSSPSYAEDIERALPAPPANTQPSRFFGPTGENQTLWSIASELRPSRGVTVQQTLLAIYRINPQAFENQNIHELIPGSRLRVPSLEQVQSATTEQAVAIMKAHEAKLKQPKPTNRATPAQRVTEQPKPQIKVEPKPVAPKPETTVAAEPKPVQKTIPVIPAPPVNTSPQGEKQVSALKDKLQGSQSELESLEEKNHRLRLMLSEVQSEVETLKNELNDEERIRSEVEKLLAEERQRLAEQQRMQPSTIDKILSNGWLVGLAALIPGALLALLVVMLLGRRSKNKEEEPAEQSPQETDPLAAPIGLAATDELDEELTLDDELFADEDINAQSLEEEKSDLEEDVFANLDDEELDFNLEGDDDPFADIGDDGDLDVGLDEFESSNNGIQVNGEEKALGLEEMERALDEVAPELEVLDDDESGFDLSDDTNEKSDSLSDDAFAELLAADEPSEELPSDTVDQDMLDDLFAELGNDDFDLDTDEPELKQPVSDDDFSVGEASDDDIDKLLAQYEQPASESEVREADANEGPVLDENSTELLDELIDFDEDDTDEFDPLNELEAISGFEGDDSIEELDADSTDLLDELIDDVTSELDEETEADLDPFDDLIREDESPEQNKSEEEELLKSLGFGESDADEKPSPVVESEQTHEDQDIESGLDIDALLSESQPDTQQAVEDQPLTEPEATSEPFSSDEFLGDLEDLSPENDPLMSELDDLFESDSEELLPTEQEKADFSAELDALFDSEDDLPQQVEKTQAEIEEASSLQQEATDTDSTQEPSVESDAEVQPHVEQEEDIPAFTPTPNTIENEFGVPQEEDWLLDEPELEPETESTNDSEEEFNFDELDLPEFSEEDALASMAGEPALETSESVESEQVEAGLPTESEDEFNFDELDLPEFSEEDALASMADEPELETSESVKPEQVEADLPTESEEEFNFDELDLPEFSEEDALASMTDEPELETSESVEPEQVEADLPAESEDEVNFDEIDLPEFSEEDALASMAGEPTLETSESVKPEQVEADLSAESEEEFNFDELDLPEFSEDDALASMAGEPALETSESVKPEQVEADLPTESEEEFNFDELDLPEFSEEDALASMAGGPALETSESVEPEQVEADLPAESEEEFNFDELDLPEFSEEDALASMEEEPELPSSETADIEPISGEDEELSFDDQDLPEFNEEDVLASMNEGAPESPKVEAETSRPAIQADNDHDALFEVFAQQNGFDTDPEVQSTATEGEPLSNLDDESSMANLLAEDANSEVFEGKLDSDTIASAGMDFETMLDVGDDWDGFKPAADNVSSTEEVPEDQRDVWNSSDALSQPEIAQENWAEQSDLDDFDPKKNQFMTIDELMAQVDREGGEFEEEDLKLDVGLNEFPDVIGEIGDIDVDNNAEAAGKLDLAKIYLEMNDSQGAIKLLEEAIVYGEDDIRREAKSLIDAINGR